MNKQDRKDLTVIQGDMTYLIDSLARIGSTLSLAIARDLIEIKNKLETLKEKK